MALATQTEDEEIDRLATEFREHADRLAAIQAARVHRQAVHVNNGLLEELNPLLQQSRRMQERIDGLPANRTTDAAAMEVERQALASRIEPLREEQDAARRCAQAIVAALQRHFGDDSREGTADPHGVTRWIAGNRRRSA